MCGAGGIRAKIGALTTHELFRPCLEMPHRKPHLLAAEQTVNGYWARLGGRPKVLLLDDPLKASSIRSSSNCNER